MEKFFKIRLLFSGDFAPMVDPKDISNNHFIELQSVFANSDLHITNLECPLTNAIKGIIKTGPVIKASPACIELLKQTRVSIACLSNNHIFDYGEQGINDTIKTCRNNNIDTLGIVSGKDGREHWLIKTIKDKKIGFLNYCEHEFSVREKGFMGACGYNPVDAYYDIKELRPIVDFLIVIYHGGNEYYPLPRPDLKKDFHYMADLGSDAVIGHHTHVFSGYEIYKNKPLIYSLGNFFFPYEGEPESWHYGLVCVLGIDEKISIEFKHILQCKGGLKISRLTSEEENKFKLRIEELSNIIKNDNELKKYWNDFVTKNGSGLIRLFLYPSKIDKLMKKIGLNSNCTKRAKAIFNVIRCSSLNNLLLDSLEPDNKT